MSPFCANSGAKLTKNGYGLLKTGQDPVNRYRLAVFMTAEGEQLVQKIARLMVSDKGVDDFRYPISKDSSFMQMNSHLP